MFDNEKGKYRSAITQSWQTIKSSRIRTQWGQKLILSWSFLEKEMDKSSSKVRQAKQHMQTKMRGNVEPDIFKGWCTVNFWWGEIFFVILDRSSTTSVRLMWISTWLVVKVSEHLLTSLRLYYVNTFYWDFCFLFSLCGGTIRVRRLLLRVDNKETSFCLCSWCCALLPESSWSHIVPQIRALWVYGEYRQLMFSWHFWHLYVNTLVSCVVAVSTLYTDILQLVNSWLSALTYPIKVWLIYK